MKAEINGVKLEGTPAELAEYVRLVAEKKADLKPFDPPEWLKDYLKRVPGSDSSGMYDHIQRTGVAPLTVGAGVVPLTVGPLTWKQNHWMKKTQSATNGQDISQYFVWYTY